MTFRRGEIRWYAFGGADKRRPVLVLSRDEVAGTLNEIIVAPITRTVRRIATEVPLTTADGMPHASAINFDHVALAQRIKIGALIAMLDDDRWPEVEQALLVACGFRS